MPPLNLNKAPLKEELDYGYMRTNDAIESLKGVFKRDFIDNPCIEFMGKPIIYVREGNDETKVFKHVIMNEEYKKREFIDDKRAKRLHWVKTLLEKSQKSQGTKYWIFSHNHDKHGLKTYIYHRKLRHLVILEPNSDATGYFFTTAFQVTGTGIDDLRDKYENKLPDLY